MDEILKFKYDDKWYILKNEDGKFIKYKEENGKLSLELTPEEKNIFNEILYEITPSFASIYLSNYKLGDKEYKIYLDLKTNFRIFDPIPPHDDLVILNNIFNNMSEEVYLEKGKASMENFVKKIIKHNNKIIIVLLSASLCFQLLAADVIINKNIELHEETLSRIESSINYSNDEVQTKLYESIKSNPNITDTEKENIVKYLWVFADNKNYLDLDYFYDVLSTLRIEYVEEEKIPYDNHYTTGSYNTSENKITFYKAKSIKDVKESTWSHELFHTMQKRLYKNYNSYIVETVNSIFNEEYSSFYENSAYDLYYNYTKMLMEIIGSEPFKKYQGYSSLDPIIDALCEITGSKVDAKRLLANMENYKMTYDRLSPTYYNYEKQIEYLSELNSEIIKDIGIYYESKFGISMDNDLIMLSYYDNDKFLRMVEERDLPKGDSKNILITQNNMLSYFRGNTSLNEIQLLYSVPVVGVMIDPVSNTKIEKHYSKEQWIKINNENRYLVEPKLEPSK